MDRRSFLTRLGTAALGATALAIDNPERLLWIPGAKTIIDFGATKQVLPATDAEMVNQAFTKIIAAGPLAPTTIRDMRRFADDVALRDYRLDIGGGGKLTSFHYRNEKLVSTHSPEELRLLDQSLHGVNGRAARTVRPRNPDRVDFSLIDVKEDYEV